MACTIKCKENSVEGGGERGGGREGGGIAGDGKSAGGRKREERAGSTHNSLNMLINSSIIINECILRLKSSVLSLPTI